MAEDALKGLAMQMREYRYYLINTPGRREKLRHAFYEYIDSAGYLDRMAFPREEVIDERFNLKRVRFIIDRERGFSEEYLIHLDGSTRNSIKPGIPPLLEKYTSEQKRHIVACLHMPFKNHEQLYQAWNLKFEEKFNSLVREAWYKLIGMKQECERDPSSFLKAYTRLLGREPDRSLSLDEQVVDVALTYKPRPEETFTGKQRRYVLNRLQKGGVPAPLPIPVRRR